MLATPFTFSREYNRGHLSRHFTGFFINILGLLLAPRFKTLLGNCLHSRMAKSSPETFDGVSLKWSQNSL